MLSIDKYENLFLSYPGYRDIVNKTELEKKVRATARPPRKDIDNLAPELLGFCSNACLASDGSMK